LIAQMHILGAWYRCTCAISHAISTSCDMLFCLVYLSLSLSAYRVRNSIQQCGNALFLNELLHFDS